MKKKKIIGVLTICFFLVANNNCNVIAQESSEITDSSISVKFEGQLTSSDILPYVSNLTPYETGVGDGTQNRFLTKEDSQGITYYLDISDKIYNAGVWSIKTLSEEVNIPNTFNLNGIDIPVTTIKNYAFDNANNLTSIYIPKSVTYLSAEAFNKYSSNTTVYVYPNQLNIPKINVKENYSETKQDFEKQQQLSSLKSSDILPYVSKLTPDQTGVAYGTQNRYITEKDSQGIQYYIDISDKGYNAGVWDIETSNEEIKIPYSFNLNGIDIPVSVIKIWAFDKSTNINSVYIPSTIKYSLDRCFDNCSNEITVYLNSSATRLTVPRVNVVTVGDDKKDTMLEINYNKLDTEEMNKLNSVDYNKILECLDGIEPYYITDNMKEYITEEDFYGICYCIRIYNYNNQTSYDSSVISVNTDKENIRIPYSFNVNGVYIPVKYIFEHTFDNAPNLKNIYIPKTVNFLSAQTFNRYSSDTTVYVYPNQLTIPKVKVIVNEELKDDSATVIPSNQNNSTTSTPQQENTEQQPSGLENNKSQDGSIGQKESSKQTDKATGTPNQDVQEQSTLQDGNEQKTSDTVSMIGIFTMFAGLLGIFEFKKKIGRK